MYPKYLSAFALVSLSLAACDGSVPAGPGSEDGLVSCYDTADGMVCVPTPGGPATEPVDANGDGVLDEFVCADNDAVGSARRAHTGYPDAAPVPGCDAGVSHIDASTPHHHADAAPHPYIDAAVPVPDAAVPVPDAAVPVPDAAVPVPDAAIPAPDAAAPEIDAGDTEPPPPRPDAGDTEPPPTGDADGDGVPDALDCDLM